MKKATHKVKTTKPFYICPLLEVNGEKQPPYTHFTFPNPECEFHCSVEKEENGFIYLRLYSLVDGDTLLIEVLEDCVSIYKEV